MIKYKGGKLPVFGVGPIYSAFLFIFTGTLFLAYNLYLILLSFIFWGYLTILMKCTEEKWLKEKFGNEYELYTQRVNRVIPWFRKNKRESVL